MKTAFEALKKSYGPIFTSRIGLRYINELNTKNTNTKSIEEILEILNDDLKHLALNSTWSVPKKANHQLSLEDNGNELTIRMAFEKAPNPTLLLDFDYFVLYSTPREIDLKEINDNLSKFHKNCYNAFRWSIREERLDVFAPR